MWCFLFCRHILYHISKGFSIKIVDICSFTDGLLKNLHGFRKYDKTAQDDSDAAAKKKSNNKKHPKIKPPVKLPPGKGTSRDKPLSQAEIAKALAGGARFGASNQLAANEEQRCISLISRRFYECWTDFEWSENLRPVHLMVRFGSGGKILGYRIIQSSGNEKMDMSVLAAAKRAGYVAGLSSEFLKRYPEVTIEMKPKR